MKRSDRVTDKAFHMERKSLIKNFIIVPSIRPEYHLKKVSRTDGFGECEIFLLLLLIDFTLISDNWKFFIPDGLRLAWILIKMTH